MHIRACVYDEKKNEQKKVIVEGKKIKVFPIKILCDEHRRQHISLSHSNCSLNDD